MVWAMQVGQAVHSELVRAHNLDVNESLVKADLPTKTTMDMDGDIIRYGYLDIWIMEIY